MNLPKGLSSHTRKILASAYVYSVVRYSALTFVSLPYLYQHKLYKLLIKTARWVNNSYNYKKSAHFIFKNANLKDESQLAVISSFHFINRIVSNRVPSQLYSKLTFPKRSCNTITVNCKGKQLVSSYFFLSLNIYNQISPEINFKSKRTITDSLECVVNGRGVASGIVRKAKA